MKKYTVLFATLLFATSCRPAVAVDERQDEPENPTVAGNISNQTVNAFAEDAQGHIWIATFRG
ncbi:MAG: hypothetical protein K2L04_04715, partial [Alistipes sp.]|nr:hypothetical protein [Alistipes sp.]